MEGLSFLQSDLRYYPESQEFVFSELMLVEGSKLMGYPVLPRYSWHTEVSLLNDKPDCKSCINPRGLFDLGKSMSFFYEKLDTYAMVRALYLDTILDKGYGLSLGISAGLFYTPLRNVRGYLGISRTRNLSGLLLDEIESSWNLDGPGESDIRLLALIQRLKSQQTKQELSVSVGYSF
ncbi:MAG: hypothetical protein HRU09_20260 [Oligoflexales bacterium]|nr:hypothetical protein [Oligoflexales bacterium]